MEKEEKLKTLSAVADGMGLSFEEVVLFWQQNGLLKKKPQSTVDDGCPRKYPKVIYAGMYVYADGMISAKVLAGKQIMAVAAVVEKGSVLAVCLDEFLLPFSSDNVDVILRTDDETDGAENTFALLDAGTKQGKHVEAAERCYRYHQNGVQYGTAFLPSYKELESVLDEWEAVNAALRAIKASELQEMRPGYMASNCHEKGLVKGRSIGCGWKRMSFKMRCKKLVRPFIRIKIEESVEV